MSEPETRPDIFNRHKRRIRRQRMMRMGGDAFLNTHLEEEVAERFDDIGLPIETILLIGGHLPELRTRLSKKAEVTIVEASPGIATRQDTIVTDEDALLHDEALQGKKFDAIVWPGGLESVNDIPGALIQCRHLLKPGGVLIGGFVGGGSLTALKSALMKAEEDRPAARLHPQIDLRAMGDLLLRCGFVLPVVDNHSLTVRYSSLQRLVQDLRESALTNVLAGHSPAISKAGHQKLKLHFSQQADDDGKVRETFQFILFSGWTPDGALPVAPMERGQNLKL